MPTVNNPYVNPVDLANTAPKYHASQHSKGGFDPLTPADIGAAPADHSHDTPVSVAWDNVTGKPAKFSPSVHAATHGSDGGDPIALDASQIASGIVPLERLPHGCLERLVIVANDEARFALTTAQVQQGDTVKVESTQMMYFVVDESKLNSPDGYVAYTAGAASAVDWSAVTGKPETYPSSWSQISGKPVTYSPSSHAATHASGGSDPITPASIGAAAADHTHSGVVQSVTVVCTPTDGSGYIEFSNATWMLPIVPGVTYTGSIEVSVGSNTGRDINFIGSDFSVIGSFTVEPDYLRTMSIPDGTRGVFMVDGGIRVFPFTVSYQ